MEKDPVDILIIGAGVIGLAVAGELSHQLPDSSIVLIEQHESFGRETSSRNSEVIHAGIYYPTGTLKARLCVEGNRLLYDFCRKWDIAHQRVGKLIVANTSEEYASLEVIKKQAEANGVTDLEVLDEADIKKLEPHIRAKQALYSPGTGIVNSHTLMTRLEELARQGGVLTAYCHRVTAVEPLGSGYQVRFKNPNNSSDTLNCRKLINCAGLQADQIAALAGIDIAEAGYVQHYCRGEYFKLPRAKAALVSRLIYPPPLHELTGLGIHVTKTLDGNLLLGPNAIYTESLDYKVDPDNRSSFYRAVKQFLPFVGPEDLEPEMAGIRPKLSGKGEPFRDFVIAEESARGFEGLINLIGIESPGLTCCLSIARYVGSMLSDKA